MNPGYNSAIATYGAVVKAKLANPAAKGEPENQLRAPLENLIVDLAEFCGFSRSDITAVGESSLAELKTRPDYAVTVRKALVGFIEVKAPVRGQTRGSSRTSTTRDNGKSSSRCRTSSTPTVTSSACGATGRLKGCPCACSAT